VSFNQIMQYVSWLLIIANACFGSFVAAWPSGSPLPAWVVPAVAALNAVGHALPSAGITAPTPPIIKALLIASLMAFGLSACAHELGVAGRNPGAYECKGKAVISFQGSGGVGAGIVGSEMNSGSVTFDCGPDGAYLKQGLPSITDAPVVVKAP
jgi:hypothetical protein